MARTSAGIKVTITGAKELAERFGVMPDEVKDQVSEEVTGLTHELFGRIQAKVGGSVLRVITGKYLASLRERVTVSRYRVRGAVRSTLGRRAGFLEFGGHAAGREIAPKKAKALRFLTGGGEVYAAIAHHPGPRIAPHSAFLASIKEMQGQVMERLETAARVHG